ncbi:MAG: 8-amino-7-oxononanoate synthase [Actinobacteria bacterium]|nr:8-amino-7-oxononanoate synthase [Actinomycetota bacterium]
MTSFHWAGWAAAQNQSVRESGRWRSPRIFDGGGPEGSLEGRRVVSFASNDYLGLSQHPAVIAAACAAVERWGAGSGAARLIVGSRPVHHDLERALAAWKDEEAAVVFSTGFAANLGTLTTFAGRGRRVLSDELNHASIIDGCQLSRATVDVYRHRSAEHCAEMLAASAEPAVVVSDLVFSMDGDLAPVAELAAACRERGALLVLDEAHAVLAPAVVPDCEYLRVGTLSKTLGALGGYVAGRREFIDLLVNRARSYIFTTALSPADAAAALAAVGIVAGPEGEGLRQRLRAVVDRVRPGYSSPIVPVVIGAEDDAMAVADALLQRGVLVPAIRPPTVPAGTSRLRVALSAAHTDDQIDALIEGLDTCWPAWRDTASVPR